MACSLSFFGPSLSLSLVVSLSLAVSLSRCLSLAVSLLLSLLSLSLPHYENPVPIIALRFSGQFLSVCADVRSEWDDVTI